jgi:predicted RNA-binding Zn-ribbon protein involved in translation (DUF1610 family)
MTRVPGVGACGERLSEACTLLESVEFVCPNAGVRAVQQVTTRRKATM